MNLKKKMMVVAVLLLGSGFSFAASWNCEKVQSKLQHNEVLPLEVIDADLTECKKELGTLAKNQIREHKNYTAYANAAIVYATEDEWSDWHVVGDTSYANVQNYAKEAINREGSSRSPNMHYVRAIVVERHFNLDMANNQGEQCFKDSVRGATQEVKAMLADFEEVGRRQPKKAPWSSMAAYYRALGGNANVQNAKRCERQARAYETAQQEQTSEDFANALKNLLQA